eukprot:1156647-Pelagomonas_calceolata.AAC.11
MDANWVRWAGMLIGSNAFEMSMDANRWVDLNAITIYNHLRLADGCIRVIVFFKDLRLREAVAQQLEAKPDPKDK